MAIEFNSTAGLGLNTGVPNFEPVMEKITNAELARLVPNENLQTKYKVSHNSWKEAKNLLEQVKLAADPFLDSFLINSKTAISSDPDIVTATADITAAPGVYPIVVDKIALYHQIASQGYIGLDSKIGQGIVELGLLDERPLRIVIDSTNDTVQGLVDTINNQNIDVTASVIQVDSSETPYKIILSSKLSGKEGEIFVRTNLTGGVLPRFDNRYTQPTRWFYAPRIGELYDQDPDLSGVSSAIPVMSGDYTGSGDISFTLTALNSGRIGVTENLNLGWVDSKGRNGIIPLGKFQYSPGSAVEIVDGVKIAFEGGELVINDSFKVNADSESFNFFSDNTPPTIGKPTTWNQQTKSAGALILQGKYQGEDDDAYTINVRKGGIIGVTDGLLIDYESENGERGTFDAGLGYKSGTPVSIGNGLNLSLGSGALQEGYTSSFFVSPTISQDYWWLFDDNNTKDAPSDFSRPLNWEGAPDSNIPTEDQYDPRYRKSNAKKEVTGYYKLLEDKKYKFTAQGDGRVGISDGLYLEWTDNKGNSGTLEVGNGYIPGSEIPIEGGLNLKLYDGFIFDGDHFYVDAFTSIVQPAQDAEVRVNVTETRQGGNRVTSSTNDMKNAIEGVVLHLHKAEDKLVNITIGDNIEKIKEAIKAFVEAYNKALVYMKEVLKYDPETKIAGPLQADSTLNFIQDELRRILVDAIPELPRDANTLPYAGITINKDALIEFDEELLDQRLVSDFDKVANLFRNYAASTNEKIFFVNSKSVTKTSGKAGFNVDIQKPANKGYYTSAVIDGPINIIKDSDKYIVEIDGRQSEPITIDDGIWTLRQVAKEIKKKIKKDKNLAAVDFTIAVEANRLKIYSESYGSKSSANIRTYIPPNEKLNYSLPFTNGQITKGKDVVGMINGHIATGNGQLLQGAKDFPEDGLLILSTLKQGQIKPGDEANLVYSIGKGTIVSNYLDRQLKKNTGPVDTTIKNVSDRIQSLEDRLNYQKERIQRKQDRLAKQFSRAEARIGTLRVQQAEISNLGL